MKDQLTIGPQEGNNVMQTIQTIVDAFTMMVNDRVQYKRFDESLTKGVLQRCHY